MNIDKLSLLAISRCLKPKTINTHYGRKTIPCGKCRYCKHSQKYRFKTLLQNELAFSPAIYFTLTYAPKFLPIIETHIVNANEKYSMHLEPSIYVHRNSIIISTLNPSQSNTIINCSQFLKYRNYNSKDIPNNYYAVLETKDIQLFLKNLRKVISKNFNETFRFYCLAEYGGQSFRPHYHFILFGKNAHQYIRYARKVWKYGFLYNSGTVNSQNFSLSNYLSQYLAGTSSIPSFLTETRPPKIFHSKNFGYSSLIPFAKDFYQNPSLLLSKELNIYTLDILHCNEDGSITGTTRTTINPKTLSKFVCENSIPFNNEYPFKYIKKTTNSQTQYTIIKQTYKITIPLDFINYLFPNVWGRPRNLSYLDSLLLNSYDNLHRPESLDLFIKLFLSEPSLFQPIGLNNISIFSINTSHCIYDTPISLQLNLSQESINFLISTQTPLSDYQQSYEVLYTEFKRYSTMNAMSSAFESQIHQISHLLNRITSVFYRSKHYCTNIKQHFQSFKQYYDTYLKFNNLLEKSKLSDYFSLLEFNYTYPYEYFLLDFPIQEKSQIQHILLPLQTEFLKDLTKHKEINNRNEQLFKTNTSDDELPF